MQKAQLQIIMRVGRSLISFIVMHLHTCYDTDFQDSSESSFAKQLD